MQKNNLKYAKPNHSQIINTCSRVWRRDRERESERKQEMETYLQERKPKKEQIIR